jgi:hypothetical protein
MKNFQRQNRSRRQSSSSRDEPAWYGERRYHRSGDLETPGYGNTDSRGYSRNRIPPRQLNYNQRKWINDRDVSERERNYRNYAEDSFDYDEKRYSRPVRGNRMQRIYKEALKNEVNQSPWL